MVLEDWDRDVRPHLNLIEAGAEMASRHARRLPTKPEWSTAAQVELEDARITLEAALKEIVAAQAAYESKPTLT